MTSPTIALIGYRGSGKTTIAQLLSRQLGWDWEDADVEIELQAGKAIATIFAEAGETFFRDLEVAVVANLCQREKCVLALGGGAVLRAENRRCLADCQAIIWLKASEETIFNRISADPTSSDRRPNLTNRGGRNEIQQLLAEREPIYASCATLVVDTENKVPARIVEEIILAMRG